MARGKVWSRGTVHDQPEGKIRRSQIVTSFGPGAMVDLVEHAVMVQGLESWSYHGTPPVLDEPRLRQALADRFQAAGRRLSRDSPFRQPPVGDDKEPTRRSGVRVLEFPRWFVCQNPGCRALVRADGLELKGDRYVHDCNRFGRPSPCVPVRFVAACPRGHVQDFPWREFAHRNAAAECPVPSLQLLEGATGDFSEIQVRCTTCGARERLSAALVPEGLFPCWGQRPWLGPDAQESCDQRLRLLVRSASNAYFAQVVSAISIPEPGRELEARVREVWTILQAATPETLPAFRTIPQVAAALAGWSDADVMAVVETIRNNEPAPQEPLRTAEYRQLMAQGPEIPGELPGAENFFARQAAEPEGGLPSQVARLVLVKKLREVRAQVGFTRLEPVTPDLQGEFDLGVQSAPVTLTEEWLPAVEIRGEGFFLQLDEEAVREWERRPEVRSREEDLRHGYAAWTGTLQDGGTPPDFPGARFYLLHSLAHLLISAVSLECGYAASAIRERIYCGPAGSPVPMAGILLYTGTPGSEGTLGGLVEQGRHVRSHLRRAWDLGVLCSNDPVCASHSPRGDHAERFLEGAACHGCLFISEPSCERFNRYLDRALVVPTLGHDPALAFFGERL
jgi:hypothetical protein